MNVNNPLKPILILGEFRQAFEVAVCLQQSGHDVEMIVKDERLASETLTEVLFAAKDLADHEKHLNDIRLINDRHLNSSYELAIVFSHELLVDKQTLISFLESKLDNDTLIAINTESISLDDLQKSAQSPDRIVGLNWTSPAYTTFFLELISNEKTNSKYVDKLLLFAKAYWKKDPYHIRFGRGIRSKMMAAMLREASHLIENGYASIKDIDRACRNDAGYYLPFSGNFRYMDLMGTAAYGIVMKDLNPELSDSYDMPAFFTEIIDNGGKGLENNKGFYHYTDQQKQNLSEQFALFNIGIRDLIARYLNH